MNSCTLYLVATMVASIFLLLFIIQAIAEKRILLNDPALLQSQIHALESKVGNVVTKNSDLSAKYNDLFKKYTDLSTKYTDLSNKYNTLMTNSNGLFTLPATICLLFRLFLIMNKIIITLLDSCVAVLIFIPKNRLIQNEIRKRQQKKSIY